MKQCTKCGESKELTDFGKKAQSTTGLQPQCKPCIKQYNRKHTLRSLESRRDYSLRSIYGISTMERDTMSEAQNHRCKICDIKEKHAPRQRLHVDHDHDTGAVRGLLCGRCNVAIGLLQDSSEFTIKATTYLQDNGK